MALLTPLTLDEARRLGAFWDIDVSRVTPLAAGSVNSNFRLELADGRAFFLRIYEEQAIEGATRELNLVRALARSGVPTPVPLASRDGRLLAEHGKKPVAIFPWLEGETLCQARVSAAHARAVGHALAEVHLARGAAAGAGRFEPADLEVRLAHIEKTSIGFADTARELRARLAAIASQRVAGLPRGVIHGDLFRDNVLWQGTVLVALLDFESAFEGPFVFDLAVTLQAWCFGDRFEPELVSGLVQGYDAVRQITEAERAAFSVEAAFAALRFAVTRITDFSLRAPPGKAPLRDYRRFLERLAVIDSGELDRLVAAVLGR